MHNTMISSKRQSPPTTTSYALDAIRNGILDGSYPLGSRLDQRAIAEELGISIVPVREAIRLLEGEGFIKLLPRRGAYVTDISVDGLEELYLIREELEGLATAQAMPRLTKGRLAELENIVHDMEVATAEQDFATLLDLNRQFHFTIYDASEMPLLIEMIHGLWNRSGLYRRVFTYLPDRASPALEEHKQILAACRQRDTGRATSAVRTNIRQTVEALAEEFQKAESPLIRPSNIAD